MSLNSRSDLTAASKDQWRSPGRKTNCGACRNVPCAGVRIARCCTRGLSIRYPIARPERGDAGNVPAPGSDISIPVRHRIRSILHIQNTLRTSPRNRSPIMASSVLRGEFRDVSATAIPTDDLGPVASPRPDWGRHIGALKQSLSERAARSAWWTACRGCCPQRVSVCVRLARSASDRRGESCPGRRAALRTAPTREGLPR